MGLEDEKLYFIKGIKLKKDEFKNCTEIYNSIKDYKSDSLWEDPYQLVKILSGKISEKFGKSLYKELDKNPNFNQEQLKDLKAFAFRFNIKRPLLLLIISKDNKFSFIDESRIEAFGEKGLFVKPEFN